MDTVGRFDHKGPPSSQLHNRERPSWSKRLIAHIMQQLRCSGAMYDLLKNQLTLSTLGQ